MDTEVHVGSTAFLEIRIGLVHTKAQIECRIDGTIPWFEFKPQSIAQLHYDVPITIKHNNRAHSSLSCTCM